MLLIKLTLNHMVALLFAVVMVAAAPSPSTGRYDYKVAKRDEIVRRGTRTHPLLRRASPLPGQVIYAVFENYAFGGNSQGIPNTVADTRTPTFDACGQLCNTQPSCLSFRYNRGSTDCSLRNGSPLAANRTPNNTFRSAFKALTCAQAKAQYTDLTAATCVEEFH